MTLLLNMYYIFKTFFDNLILVKYLIYSDYMLLFIIYM